MHGGARSFDELVARIERRESAAGRKSALIIGVSLVLAIALLTYAGREVRVATAAATAARARALSANASAAAAIQRLDAVRDSLALTRAALEAGREGINLFHAGDYSGAVSSYDRALATNPGNAYILDLKGYALFRKRDLEAAITALRDAVRADPGYGYAYFDLARVYCAAGRLQDASEAAIRALERRPDLRPYMQGGDGEFARLCHAILPSLR